MNFQGWGIVRVSANIVRIIGEKNAIGPVHVQLTDASNGDVLVSDDSPNTSYFDPYPMDFNLHAEPEMIDVAVYTYKPPNNDNPLVSLINETNVAAPVTEQRN